MNPIKYLFLLCLIILAHPIIAQFSISGEVKTETSEPVTEVEMQATPLILTDENGVYQIDNLAPGNYIVSPEKNTDYLNGVNICDVVAIMNHIQGIELFDSPYKYISADVNKSGAITAFDVVLIRQLILGIIPDFNNTSFDVPSWSFIDANFVFPNPTNPFVTEIPAVLAIQLTGDIISADLVATKMGDVNNSASGTTPYVITSNPDILFFNKPTEIVSPQESYAAVFTADNFDQVNGFQFTLTYDSTKMEFIEMTSQTLQSMQSSVFAVENGAINVAWVDPFPQVLSDGDEVFTAVFNILEETDLGEAIQFTNTYVPIITSSLSECNEIGETVSTSIQRTENDFSLLQIFPNPVAEQLNIEIEFDTNKETRLRLTDLLGQTIWVQGYETNYVQEQINIEQFADGIYMLEIEVDGVRTTQKIMKANR